MKSIKALHFRGAHFWRTFVPNELATIGRWFYKDCGPFHSPFYFMVAVYCVTWAPDVRGKLRLISQFFVYAVVSTLHFSSIVWT